METGSNLRRVGFVALGLALCIFLSLKDVWGKGTSLGSHIEAGTLALTLAALAQVTLAYFVYRQIAAENWREKVRIERENATAITDFVAACTNANAMYHQVAPLVVTYIEDPEDIEKREKLRYAIDEIEPLRQAAHAQKVRVLASSDGSLKSDVSSLIKQVDGQRRKAVKCVSWLDRSGGKTTMPAGPPDPSSMREPLPEATVERLLAKAADGLRV